MWQKPYTFFTSDEFCAVYNQNAELHLYHMNLKYEKNRKCVRLRNSIFLLSKSDTVVNMVYKIKDE